MKRGKEEATGTLFVLEFTNHPVRLTLCPPSVRDSALASKSQSRAARQSARAPLPLALSFPKTRFLFLGGRCHGVGKQASLV